MALVGEAACDVLLKNEQDDDAMCPAAPVAPWLAPMSRTSGADHLQHGSDEYHRFRSEAEV